MMLRIRRVAIVMPQCLGRGAYSFLASSRAVKNTQPPTAIHNTLGSHPCERYGQELHHLKGSKSICRTCHVAECHDSVESNMHTASPIQTSGSKIPSSSGRADPIARKTNLQEGGGALLPVDLASAVHNALVAAALSLRHEARLDHIQRRRGKACHSSSQSTNDRCLCRLQLGPPTVACLQAGLHSTTAHVDACALQLLE